MICKKHNVSGVDADNQCPQCEAEPRCFTCFRYRPRSRDTGPLHNFSCAIGGPLKPCADYMREVGSEG